MDLYDSTIDKLNKLGISWDPKRLKHRQLLALLSDTESMNGTVSNAVLLRFKHEINLRRERLTFLMDKIYNIHKLEPDVYRHLQEIPAIQILGNTNETRKHPNYDKMEGDIILSPVLKKELGTYPMMFENQ